MKKLFVFLVTLLLSASMGWAQNPCVCHSYCEETCPGDMDIDITEESGNQGDTVSVEFMVDECVGDPAIDLQIGYDHEYLTPTAYRVGDDVGNPSNWYVVCALDCDSDTIDCSMFSIDECEDALPSGGAFLEIDFEIDNEVADCTQHDIYWEQMYWNEGSHEACWDDGWVRVTGFNCQW